MSSSSSAKAEKVRSRRKGHSTRKGEDPAAGSGEATTASTEASSSDHGVGHTLVDDVAATPEVADKFDRNVFRNRRRRLRSRSVIQFHSPADLTSKKVGLKLSPVFLNVYDLKKLWLLNAAVKPLFGVGFFHVAVEVRGYEFTFLSRAEREVAETERAVAEPGDVEGTKNEFEGTGVQVSVPRQSTEAWEFKDSIYMGDTHLRGRELRELIQDLMRHWKADEYDFVSQNCAHFAETFLEALGVESLPEWISTGGEGIMPHPVQEPMEEIIGRAHRSMVGAPKLWQKAGAPSPLVQPLKPKQAAAKAENHPVRSDSVGWWAPFLGAAQEPEKAKKPKSPYNPLARPPNDIYGIDEKSKKKAAIRVARWKEANQRRMQRRNARLTQVVYGSVPGANLDASNKTKPKPKRALFD